ncbi:MAG TPA: phosphoribosyltransferase family protein [Euzebyales bacterium]|nr:phosphoribosyltransferase family protein [Euzebyales bacterium]
MRFVNREDAGRRLGYNLALRSFDQPIVIGLPRGGIPVATQVAERLQAPLDLLVVRKLAYPLDPAVGMGAVAEGGFRIIDDDLVSRLDITPAQLEGVVADEEAELDRRTRWYRGTRSPLTVEGRTVIVVDDGVATGLLAKSAVEVMRRRNVRQVVVAVPVGPARTVRDLRDHADEVVCLHAPHAFTSIRQWYNHFAPIGDDEVAALFAAHASTAPIDTA